MKRTTLVSLILWGFIVSFGAGTAFLNGINYQGYVTDPETGEPAVDGYYRFVFSIYDAAADGTLLWMETHEAVDVTGGYFHVILGTQVNFPETMHFDEEYWLEVEIGPEGESEILTPRQQMTSVGQALEAFDVYNRDINPRSVRIIGYDKGEVINEYGEWVGPQTGLAGPTGPQGDTGPEGPAGPQGDTGPEGPAGPQGFTGPMGPSGSQGDTGPQGPAGPQGDTGYEGPVGPQGFTGPMGPSGSQGDTGPQGPAGPQGDTGPEGLMGPQGFTGPMGPSGSQGDTGPQGPAGPQGNTGPEGPTGPRGPSGPVTGGTWMQNGSNIYYDSGYVGIGTDSPAANLEVNGTVKSEALVLNSAFISGTSEITDYDVSNIGILFIDPAGSWVTIRGFSGGVKGQVLHVVITDSVCCAGAFFYDNDPAGVQKFVAPGNVGIDYQQGVTLVFDGTFWRLVYRGF